MRGNWSGQWALAHEHAQDSVIRVSTLEALGIDRTTIYRRCQPSGPWQLLLPGVIALTSGRPTSRQRSRAALLHARGGAVLTGQTAALLHGLRRVPTVGQVHVLVDHARQVRSAGFALVERTTRLPEAVIRGGLPCAPLVRVVPDAARRMADQRSIQALLAETVQRGYCTPRQLREELDEGSQRGSALPRAALAAISQGARSVAEADALKLWQQTGLRAPEWNVSLRSRSGAVIGIPDAWWGEVAFAWEIDSHEFHLSPEDHERTLRRNARYAAHGIAFLQTAPSRLIRERAAVAGEIRMAYAAAARRPPPTGICVERR